MQGACRKNCAQEPKHLLSMLLQYASGEQDARSSAVPPSRRNCVKFVHNALRWRRRTCIHCRAKHTRAESASAPVVAQWKPSLHDHRDVHDTKTAKNCLTCRCSPAQQERAPWERHRQAAPRCRCTRSCGRGSAKASGRPPPGSSSNNLKSSGWGGRGFCRRGTSYSSCSSPPALAIFGPLGRYGALSRPGPSRRSSAHVAAMSGAVAVAASSRLPQRVGRCRATTTRSLGMKATQKQKVTHRPKLEQKWLRSVVVVIDDDSRMCVSTPGAPKSCINFCNEPTCTSPGGVGLCNLIISQFLKVSALQRLGIGCPQGSTPKRLRTLVFLVSRIFLLPPLSMFPR